MKRLVFCFDGTWNHLDRPNPTNVVILAQAITPLAKDGTQIIHYDPGVGTRKDDHWKGGVFGQGLIDKIVEAYTFLVFNYVPGDELFVFGFSRGAFTARAFVGFIRNLGIIQRKHAARIADAVELYKKREPGSDHNSEELLQFRWKYSPEICVDVAEDDWRVKECDGYEAGAGLVVRIKYLGVWDTVAALGVPSDVVMAGWINKGERYFDSELTSMVVSGRHAVSIDEQRTTFKPTLWPNFAELNAKLGFEPYAANAPYQQRWFPGDHGSVGGGGDIRGLSDAALTWVLRGATHMGLAVDQDEGSPLYGLLAEPTASLQNMTKVDPTFESTVEGVLLKKAPREGGPTHIGEVSDSALLRWRSPAEALPERKPYRPETLKGVAAAIEANAPPQAPQIGPAADQPAEAQPKPGSRYRIVYRDELGKLAERLYGHASLDKLILQANPTIMDPDLIYVGQIIYLPPVPSGSAAPTLSSATPAPG